VNAARCPLVLVVDDRRDIFEFCERFLGEQYAFRHVGDGPGALALLREAPADAVLLDRDFSQADPARLLGPPADVRNEGLHVLARLREAHGTLPVLMVTGLSDAAAAESAAELEAEFLAWEDVARDPSLLSARLAAAIERMGLVRQDVLQPFRERGLVVESPAMVRAVRQLAHALADSTPILLLGPTGSGKDRLARAVHEIGPCARGPFVEVNAATLDPAQVNNELFGHVKGSYTDAKSDWKGLLASADGGTFFLNEVADLPLETQARLLSVLESREVRPLGSARMLPARFRLVSATSRDLRALIAAGRFREDLWHRIAGHVVALPPLRERAECLEPLAVSFLAATAAVRAGRVRGFAREAFDYLRRQPWHGNVRSLQRVVEVAAAGAVHTVTVADLRAALRHVDTLESAREAVAPTASAASTAPAAAAAADERATAEALVFGRATLRELRRAYCLWLWDATGWNMAAAARRAGVAKSTMCEWHKAITGRNASDDPESDPSLDDGKAGGP
jgi:DNA-binding NtrC family response regulator